MALQLYHWKLISKLAPRWRFAAFVQNYSNRIERGGLDPELETRYMSLKNRPRRKPLVPVDLLAFLHRKTLTWAEVKAMLRWKVERTMREDQRYSPKKQKILGPDLAVAHLILRYNGKVKFRHQDAWVTYEDIANEKIPSHYVPHMYVEAVDASETNLCYEGFDNFTLLLYLKELQLRNCSYIDDWCLHRLSMFEASLEHLDISGCHNISERGICALHNLKNLKTLVLNDTPNVENKELACLLLQEVLPQCNIVGVDYENPSLWSRLKEYLT